MGEGLGEVVRGLKIPGVQCSGSWSCTEVVQKAADGSIGIGLGRHVVTVSQL